MLTRAKSSESWDLLAALAKDPAFGVRISALLKAYGLNLPFFNVWRQDSDAVLARLESSFFLYAESGADFEEIAFFLRFNPYFQHLTGKRETVEKVADLLDDGIDRTEFHCMSLHQSISHPSEFAKEAEANADLRAVYEVMLSAKSDSFSVSEFMPWFADVSHRIRHGCARAYLLRINNITVSACLVSAESDFAGLLSGVATKPEHRGRGYASAVVSAACRDLCEIGKLPVLECLPALVPYYAKFGFEHTGSVLVLEQK